MCFLFSSLLFFLGVGESERSSSMIPFFPFFLLFLLGVGESELSSSMIPFFPFLSSRRAIAMYCFRVLETGIFLPESVVDDAPSDF